MSEPDRTRRWALVALGVGLLGYAGYQGRWFRGLWAQKELAFEPMTAPQGYRFLKTGGVTLGSGVPLFGLDQDEPEGAQQARKTIARSLETALFGPNEPQAGTIPVAYFFDYQCPICRRLTPRLRAHTDISIAWHDLIGLGAASEIAARAAIAARQQGAYRPFHDRLMRARFQATEGYVTTLADSIGIDSARLLNDMSSEKTNRRLWLSRILAKQFGLVGTPGLVVGRSVILGDINDRDLNRILAQEIAMGQTR